jgi:hypothetical protein
MAQQQVRLVYLHRTGQRVLFKPVNFVLEKQCVQVENGVKSNHFIGKDDQVHFADGDVDDGFFC